MKNNPLTARFGKIPSLALFCLFAFVPLPAMAQDDTPPPVDEEERPEVPRVEEGDLRCRYVSTFKPDPKKPFFLKVDGAYQEFPVIGESLSQDFPIGASRMFELFNLIENEEGEEEYVQVVKQALTGAGDNFLILLRKKEGGAIASKALNLNSSNYPADHIFILNETPATLGAQIDTSQLIVKPLSEVRYGYRNAGRDSYTSAKIVMQYKGETKIMASKRLRLIPGRRAIFICFPSEERTSMGATPLRMVALQDMP
ncbi:MAG: hypothetical protein NWT08_10450 [Akkermansiaceae bacterium]|jgi:hypothetical protein|nr:hypothetical protein [Akkermansiaceae bacterium]MDP4646180.1 hypothetical protein [Akkermansiaceae bacterium]MDP4720691.1 hypothetical protein [Akkermansiaceae bacterium]MDP4780478.1 hypothetical protein [Akkermansiaceae bacterium]MDP4847281.1 hypothetical protein [Akkermansiaceae bacterium]